MMTKLRDVLRRSRRDQEGGISAEYIAVIVIVAAVIAAVWRIGIDTRVQNCGTEAVGELFDRGATVGVDC
jgi:Flp pilus assembly pilin Flp